MRNEDLRSLLSDLINACITGSKDREALHKKLCAPHTTPKKEKNLGCYDRTVAKKIQKTEKTKGNKPRPEDAYQRAIIAGKTSCWGKQEVQWMDIELPCVLGKAARQCSIDLIGRFDDTATVLCELKYVAPEASSTSDSPTYALLELLIYHYHIRKNAGDLERFRVWHSDLNEGGREWSWEQYTNPGSTTLAVIANPTYWKRRKGNWNKKSLPEIQAIKRKIGNEFTVRFFESPEADPLFSEQDRKAKGARYTPNQLTGIWKEIEIK